MFNDRDFILNSREWSGDCCCLKKRPLPGEEVPGMGYTDYGVITTSRFPLDVWRRDGTLAARYNTVDELLEAGWIVD